jgi:FAD/FMN-containing dehydrogenase
MSRHQRKLERSISMESSTRRKDLRFYSHDASLFEIKPEIIIYPKDTTDVCNLVNFVTKERATRPELSITARSGGTDMSGGAINDSIIVDFSRYFNHIGAISGHHISTQPGVYYHDFEPVTLENGLILPSYPASREICMIGGMVANNSGGEKSLTYGKTQRYVTEVKIVLADGKEHTLKPLSKDELAHVMHQKTYEAKLHRELYELVTENAELIKKSKPHVTKNSTGYNLWDVWDGETFDITKVIVGSQGTLGLLTEATFKLIPAKPLSGMVVAFLPSLAQLGKIINELLPLKPTSLESFDRHTLVFAFRFFFGFRETLGWKRFILLGLSFIPVLRKLIRFLPGLPALILLIEFEGDDQESIDTKIRAVETHLDKLGIETQRAKNKHQEEKFWIMRRESFNLLRKNVKHKHTAPFIDDLIVPPEHLPEFLPKLTEILDRYKLLYTIAGHMGDGNFHVIPLMNLQDKAERDKIQPVLLEVTKLVIGYGGSLSGEHNDGLIRGPFLSDMYGIEMVELFKQVKKIFDPDNLFNPHKKTDANWEYSSEHIRRGF